MVGKDPYGNRYYELPAQPQVPEIMVMSLAIVMMIMTVMSLAIVMMIMTVMTVMTVMVVMFQLGKRRPTRWYDTAETGRKEVSASFWRSHLCRPPQSSSYHQGPGMIEVWAGFDANLPSEWSLPPSLPPGPVCRDGLQHWALARHREGE